jgi:hypothetical protein
VVALALFLTMTGCDNPTTDAGAPASEPASTSVTDGSGNRYRVGYDQVSADDQDPYVIKENAAGEQLWGVYHDRTPVDARGILVVLDGQDRPYVAFTTDGGSNDADRFQANHVEDGAFGSAPFGSYGAGGGAKATVVARLDPETGRIERATYLIARLESGNTNTLVATDLAVTGSTVTVTAESYFTPPNAGATAGSWENHPAATGSSPWTIAIDLPLDLTTLSSVTVE